MSGMFFRLHLLIVLGPMFVENQGGAGGSVGAAAVARAPPDGHSILLGSTASLVLIPTAAKHAPYDPVKDFEPISILGGTALAIAIHPSVPARNLKELWKLRSPRSRQTTRRRG